MNYCIKTPDEYLNIEFNSKNHINDEEYLQKIIDFIISNIEGKPELI